MQMMRRAQTPIKGKEARIKRGIPIPFRNTEKRFHDLSARPAENFQDFSCFEPLTPRSLGMESVMAKSVTYAQWSLEPYCIGMKLRALRTRKHLTLSRLAAETGLSTALLSKLETERMIPTLPTLATICRNYGVGMGYFFCEPTKHCLSVTRKGHLEASGRTVEAPVTIPLNTPSENPCLIAEMVELTRTPFTFTGSNTDICALVHVLEGSAHLVTDGMSQTLETGDCAYMETRMPTSLSAVGDKRCRILMVKPAPSSPKAE